MGGGRQAFTGSRKPPSWFHLFRISSKELFPTALRRGYSFLLKQSHLCFPNRAPYRSGAQPLPDTAPPRAQLKRPCHGRGNRREVREMARCVAEACYRCPRHSTQPVSSCDETGFHSRHRPRRATIVSGARGHFEAFTKKTTFPATGPDSRSGRLWGPRSSAFLNFVPTAGTL